MEAAIDSEPLTKAKLFTLGSDGSWTEIGVGVAHVDTPQEGEAQLSVSSLEGADVLLCTPLSADDIYCVQHNTIVVWNDPLLGREVALSFSSPEGCSSITVKISDWQSSKRPSVSSPLDVNRENMLAILAAAQDAKQKLGYHIRDNDGYIKKLLQFYNRSTANKDDVARHVVSQIIVTLLSFPYNTDAAILTQFFQESVLDDVIDVVQFAIGRRTPETGFVSAADRAATFCNPAKLPDALMKQVKTVYLIQYLRDLVPLLLDDSDASISSIVSQLMLQLKYNVLREVSSEAGALAECISDFIKKRSSWESGVGLLSMVHEFTRMVKTAFFPLGTKEELFDALLRVDVVSFMGALAERMFDGLTTDLMSGMVSQMADVCINLCQLSPRHAREKLLAQCSLCEQRSFMDHIFLFLTKQWKYGVLQAVAEAATSLVHSPALALFKIDECTVDQVHKYLISGSHNSFQSRNPPLRTLLFVIHEHVESRATLTSAQLALRVMTAIVRQATADSAELVELALQAIVLLLTRSESPSLLSATAALFSHLFATANVASAVAICESRCIPALAVVSGRVARRNTLLSSAIREAVFRIPKLVQRLRYHSRRSPFLSDVPTDSEIKERETPQRIVEQVSASRDALQCACPQIIEECDAALWLGDNMDDSSSVSTPTLSNANAANGEGQLEQMDFGVDFPHFDAHELIEPSQNTGRKRERTSAI